MRCGLCGRDIAAIGGPAPCPQCAQWEQVARMQRVNAAIRSGAMGFAAGLAGLTVALVQASGDVGPAWLALPLATFALGAAFPYLRTRLIQRK